MKRHMPALDVFLHPGEFHFAAGPGRIGTLLGSCVSVTLWHPGQFIGGMSHILLPARGRSHRGPLDALDARYADESVELLCNELRRRHIAPASCQAKLFGGGNMFPGTRAMDIGHRNIEAARQALARHGFKLVAEHVGGTSRRRLYLDLANGDVWLAAHRHTKVSED